MFIKDFVEIKKGIDYSVNISAKEFQNIFFLIFGNNVSDIYIEYNCFEEQLFMDLYGIKS
jgi:hypothetical protein